MGAEVNLDFRVWKAPLAAEVHRKRVLEEVRVVMNLPIEVGKPQGE